MESVRHLIIGAGISGLATAAFLRDKDALVLEADREIGGYCKTVKQGRLRLGLLGALLPLQAPRHRGVAARAHAGAGASAPSTKTSLHRLPRAEDRLPVPEEHPPAPAGRVHRVPARPLLRPRSATCRRASRAPETNFKEMLYARFGRGIAEKFLIPYNEKLYACDLATLDKDAMGRFFPHADLTDIIRNMRSPDNATLQRDVHLPARRRHRVREGARERGAARARSRSRSRSSAIDLARAGRADDASARSASSGSSRRRRSTGSSKLAGLAHDAARVHLEQGARLQPRLRQARANAASTGSTTRTARRVVLPGRLVRQHLRHRPPEPLRRDRFPEGRRRSTSTATRARVLADLAREGVISGPPPRRRPLGRDGPGLRPHHPRVDGGARAPVAHLARRTASARSAATAAGPTAPSRTTSSRRARLAADFDAA